MHYVWNHWTFYRMTLSLLRYRRPCIQRFLVISNSCSMTILQFGKRAQDFSSHYPSIFDFKNVSPIYFRSERLLIAPLIFLVTFWFQHSLFLSSCNPRIHLYSLFLCNDPMMQSCSDLCHQCLFLFPQLLFTISSAHLFTPQKNLSCWLYDLT